MTGITVIMPAFNAVPTIRAALDSVRDQTLPPERIVVVDDGSSDGTGEIVADIAEQDPRVVLLRQPNAGISAALNRALAATDTPYVARQDADDLSAPDRFARQAAYLDAHPEVVAVSASHREIDASGRPTGRLHRAPVGVDADCTAIPAREPPLIQPFMMARRDALVAAGGYRSLPVSEDSDLYWRLLRLGRLENLPEVLGSYRMHAGSISSASIVNGRVMAHCSQLAALSARRVAAGRADIDLTRASGDALRACREPEAMLAQASPGLTRDEAVWLRCAFAAKLMELAGYRPFELEPADCRFIGTALREAHAFGDENARSMRRMAAATAARLLRLGRPLDALRIAGPRLWPQALLRAGTGRLYWTKHLVAEA